MKKIYVGNLQFTATEDDLRAMFTPFGQVESAVLVTDRGTGRSRGFGFIEIADSDAENAIKSLDGTDSGGRALTVNEARPQAKTLSMRGGGREKYRSGKPRDSRF